MIVELQNTNISWPTDEIFQTTTTLHMNLFFKLPKKTQTMLDAASRNNMKLKMPVEGRYLFINASISNDSIAGADPEDLLVPGIYKVFVPEDMNDGLAARCAFEAFNHLVPISNLNTIELAVIDPDSGDEIDIDFDTNLDSTEIERCCLGLEQYVAMTYCLSPKPYPVANLFRQI